MYQKEKSKWEGEWYSNDFLGTNPSITTLPLFHYNVSVIVHLAGEHLKPIFPKKIPHESFA